MGKHFHHFLVFIFSSASSLNVPGMYRYWPERPQSEQFSSRAWRSSSVRNSYHPPPFTEERPTELESRLEVLHSQLNRWFSWLFALELFCSIKAVLSFPSHLASARLHSCAWTAKKQNSGGVFIGQKSSCNWAIWRGAGVLRTILMEQDNKQMQIHRQVWMQMYSKTVS